MPKYPDPPMNPLKVEVRQIGLDRADVFVNDVNMAFNIMKDSLSARILPETKRVALTLTLIVDDFSHKGVEWTTAPNADALCGGAS